MPTARINLIRVDFRLAVLLIASLIGAPVWAEQLRVDNPVGDIQFNVVFDGRLEIRPSSPDRPLTRDDIKFLRNGEVVHVLCRPPDGARIDLDIDIPIGNPFRAKTTQGLVSIDGFARSAVVETEGGAVRVSAPWEATKIVVIAGEKPKEVVTPRKFKFAQRKDATLTHERWTLRDKLAPDAVTYGRIQVRASKIASLTLEHTPIPEESPVKMAWQAVEIVDKLLKPPARPRSTSRVSDKPAAAPLVDGAALFRSDVRMVSLGVSVYDERGKPLTGLEPDDFEVYEDGELQEVAVASSQEAPFNLVLLLDLSSSTQRNREQMKQAARGFIEIARPRDKVSVHMIARNWFVTLSRLTSNRRSVLDAIETLPDLSGGSPIYDSIALAYGHELPELRDQRNAIVVLTDGVDNRLYGMGLPSKVSFDRLLLAAPHMETLIYPIFIGPRVEDLEPASWPNKAYQRLWKLAAAGGGRVFTATTLAEVAGVYAEVAAELRSIYNLAYYPANQNFDGAWRQVQVKPRDSTVRVRARSGYAAR